MKIYTPHNPLPSTFKKPFHRKRLYTLPNKETLCSLSSSCSIDFPFRNISCSQQTVSTENAISISQSRLVQFRLVARRKRRDGRFASRLENRVAESAGEDLVACRLGIKNRSAWKLPSRETLLFTYELRFPCRVTKLWRIQVPGLPSFSNHVLLFHVRKYDAPSLSSFLPTSSPQPKIISSLGSRAIGERFSISPILEDTF